MHVGYTLQLLERRRRLLLLSSKEEENIKIKGTLPCVVCGRETYDTVEVKVLVDYQTVEILMCEACADRHYQALETCDFNDC